MGKTLKDVVTNYQLTGDCEVDIDLVVSKWNHTWGIYQWNTQYRLIKQVRIGSSSNEIKVQISESQANEIIDRLKLDAEDGMFLSAITWRQSKEFWTKHNEFLFKRSNKSKKG